MSNQINTLILNATGASSEAAFVSFENSIRSPVVQRGNIHTLSSSSAPSTTQVGTQFEQFCEVFLKYKGYECWKLEECPHLSTLNLTKRDVGIDLIARCNNEWYAVQCKFRSPTRDKLGRVRHCLGWKELSTFLSIAARTGGSSGWTKHIVITNAKNVSWQGRKTDKDMTIARATLMSDFLGLRDSLVTTQPASEPTAARDVRNLRQEWLDRLSSTKKA